MSETLSIRAAIPADLPKIDALLSRSYPALLKDAYPPSTLVTAIPLISKAQPRLIASGTYFVVTDEDQIIGAGGWTRAVPGSWARGSTAIGNIRHVVTDHRQTRRGIGRALMAHIIASARTSGVTQLDCFSTLMAEPFYQACGFETVAPIKVNLAPGIDFPAIRMQMTL